MTTTIQEINAPLPIPDLYEKSPVPVPELLGGRPLPISVPEELVSSPTSVARRPIRWSIPLSLLGLAAVLFTAASEQHLDPGLWGLPGSMHPTWYLGLALIIAGAATARRSDGHEIGIAAVCLVLALTGTSVIVYDIARLPWAEKHVGVVNYILQYGQVHPSIDIYQAWPGLFSAIAWISRVGGLHNPLDVARLWPPLIDLLELFTVRYFAGRLLSNNYRAWMAAALFMLASAFNLDYFSPQAISLFLALALYATVVPVVNVDGTVIAPYRLPTWRIVVVGLLSLAIAVTHQITPYFVVASLAVLVIFGFLRPRWVALVPLAPAAAWAIFNYPAWKGYFSFSGIGNVLANIATPGARISGQHPDIVLRISTVALAAGPFVVGVLAVIAVLQNRSRLNIALIACAASAGTIVLATDYGQEGLYRTTLFALPWLAVVAVGRGRRAISHRAYIVVPLLVLLVTTFIFANFALDGWNVVRPSEIQAESDFELSATSGSVLISLGAASSPNSLTYRYSQLQFENVEVGNHSNDQAVIDSLLSQEKDYPSVYVFTSESSQFGGELLGLYTPKQYEGIVEALHRSSRFRTVLFTKATQLFEAQPSTNR